MCLWGCCGKAWLTFQRKQFPICISRPRVEAPPVEDSFFDGALCCGSLHLSDTALRDMARVMKPAAILSVFNRSAQPSSSQYPHSQAE